MIVSIYSNKDISIVKLLIDNNAYLDLQNKEILTALMCISKVLQ